MRKFFLRLTMFIFPLIAGFILQYLVDEGLKKSSISQRYKEWNAIFESDINADILVQGNSRASVQISPKSIDSSFKVNSYNLGVEGYQFHMQYYKFLAYLKYNKKPDFIIQNIDVNSTLTIRKDLYELEQFLPYLSHPEIRNAVLQYKGLDYRSIYIPFYKYLSHKKYYIEGLTSFFKKTKSHNDLYKGFMPHNRTWDGSFEKYTKEHPNGVSVELDSETKILFIKFLDLCKSKDIKVIFVYCPEYIPAQKMVKNRDSILDIFKTLSNTYEIPTLDYSQDSISFIKDYFYNSQHLNYEGVRLFNKKLMRDLDSLSVSDKRYKFH